MGKISKIIIVGAKETGKTAILESAVYGNTKNFKNYFPTIEDTYVALVETDRGTKEKLRFYDTSGIDKYNRALPHHYHAVADAYILVYSITNNLSFQLLIDIKRDIEKNKEKKDVPIIVLGNKLDEAANRCVYFASAEKWVESEKMHLWEVTAKNRNTLIEPLVFLASKLNPQQSKTAFHQLSMGRKNKD